MGPRAAYTSSGSPPSLVLAGCATPTFDLQGHRGARGLAPENTLPAFATALSLGVTTLELDVGITKDDVIVVSHDPYLNPDITRDAGGACLKAKGPTIHSLALADLQRYDVGRINPASRYAKTHAAQQPVDGTRIPRLADVFALARRAGNRDVRFNIETKISPLAPADTLAPDAFAERLVADDLRQRDERQVTIQSFDWRTLRRVQTIAPEIPTVYLSAQQSWTRQYRRGQARRFAVDSGVPGARPRRLGRADGEVPRAAACGRRTSGTSTRRRSTKPTRSA